MPSDNVAFTRRAHLNPGMREQFAAIYEESFPPEERDETAKLLSWLEAGDFQLYTAEEGDELVGLAVMTPLRNTGVMLLDYLAIRRDYRNRGVGAAFLAFLHDTFCNDERVRGIFLTAESDEWGTAEERELRYRRIEFYRRNGGSLVSDASFAVPSTTDDSVIEVKALWLPTRAPGEILPDDLLRRCIVLLFTDTYHLDEGDQFIHEALRRLMI